jgi:hypothetical protein
MVANEIDRSYFSFSSNSCLLLLLGSAEMLVVEADSVQTASGSGASSYAAGEASPVQDAKLIGFSFL